MKKLAIGLASSFVLSMASYASATTVLTGFMTGAQEVPPTGSPGTGGCRVVLDETTGALTMTGSFSGLAGTATAAHIHGPAPVGMSAPVLIGATFTAATSGQIGIASGTLTPSQVTDMLNGLTYCNVHSTVNGGGEIRGQLTVAPGSPAMPTWGIWMFGVGLLGAGALLISRRARTA
jgi:hypothetical protein